MKSRPVLTAKDRADIKIMVQYEVKPIRDEQRKTNKELRELKAEVKELNNKVDALVRLLATNVLTVELNKAMNPPVGVMNFTQKDGTKSEPPY